VLTAGARAELHGDSAAPDRQNDPNIWDAATGALLHTLKEPDRNWSGGGHIVAAAFGAGGRYVVTTHDYGRVARLWDAATGVEVATNFVGHGDTVRAAAFSPDGRFLATGSADGTARLWDLGALQTTAPHRGRWKVDGPSAFSADGRRLAVTSLENPRRPGWASHIHIWDLDMHRAVVCKGDGQFLVTSLAFSPDGRRLVAGCWDRHARWWDTITGEPGPVLHGHEDKVLDARFSPDSSRIVTTSRDGTVRVWDAASGRQTLLLRKGRASLRSASFNPDGRLLLAGTAGPEADPMGNQGWIWDAETGKERAAFGASDSIAHVPMAWSPDGRRVLAAVRPGGNVDNSDAAKALCQCNAATGGEVCRLTGHTKAITCAAFSPDGRLIITGSDDRTARVWDAATGAPRAVLRGHEEAVSAVAFASNGRWAVSVCTEAVRLWDAALLADPPAGRSVRPLAVWAGDPRKRAFGTGFFSPDSRRLLTAADSPEGTTVQLWPLDPLSAAMGRKPRDLTAEERELYEVPEPGLSPRP
jgi:WD40 repeat protein